LPLTNEQVGGSRPGEGNVISGNFIDGFDGYSEVGDVIQGNKIGTDASGTTATDPSLFPLANFGSGIHLYQSVGTQIGGAGAGNVVSGNFSDGIDLISETGDVIQGNNIGTDAAGTTATGTDLKPLANLGGGVFIDFFS